MPEMSNRPPSPGKTESIDPVVFDDETVFGLDPAVHWVQFNGQNEQFPSIVPHIVEHWSDLEWLTKLVERAGFNTRIYDAETNPRGILTRVPEPSHTKSGGISHIRYFVLRASGIAMETCHYMFSLDSRVPLYEGSKQRGTERIVPKPVEQDVAALRRKLKAGEKK